MDFWMTVAGQRLATILSTYLPELSETLSKPQYTILCENTDKAADVIKDSIDNGHEFINSVQKTDGSVLLIMKK